MTVPMPPGRSRTATRAKGASPPAASDSGPHAAAQPLGQTTHPGPSTALTLEPQLIEASGELEVTWSEVRLGLLHSRACRVRGAGGHTLSVLVEQGAYRKTISANGAVDVAAIPGAAKGTRGSLLARDETSAAWVRYEWTWLPPAQAKAQAAKQRRQRRAAAKRERAAAIDGRALEQTQVRFFGACALARRIAFVLDFSGSMGGVRWARCTSELAATLQALGPGTQFFVVLFSDRLLEPPGQMGWTSAAPQPIQDVIAWLASSSPTGGTVPRPALERVFTLSPKPDALYFLTDGEFSDPSPTEVARMNGRGARPLGRLLGWLGLRASTITAVHTLGLDTNAGEEVLKQIARDSGGSYAAVRSTETSGEN